MKVASVIGNFNAVPKQAQRIDFLSKSALVTPKIINVIIKAMSISKRIKNIKPNNVSMKGYILP